MKSASFCIVLSLIAGFASCGTLDKGWWKSAVFYQVYPRSFVDSNGDGIGDLRGITSKLSHFVDSGVQAILLSSINRSPMVDFGYDVSDFKDVDQSFGKLADFKVLLERAKELGLKVILDLVPNHTSDQHYWFQQSIKSEGKYSDYYVWAVGKNNNKEPPNNWVSVYGGPAWTYNDARKMWYLHQFEYRQPDLNYDNPEVKKEMEGVIWYWLDEGVDGFCVRAAPYIFEDEKMRDEPRSNIRNVTNEDYMYLNHIYTKDHPKTYELVESWRHILDDYAELYNSSEKVLMSEAYTSLQNTMKFYTAGSHVPFNFQFIVDVNSSSSAVDFKRVIDDWMRAVPKNGVANWVIGNHDHSRAASRYPERADQLTMLVMILPGVAVTYNGEEIGMVDNTDISFNQTQDLVGRLVGPQRYKLLSRDPYRTPYQWDNTTNAGFSNSSKTWLPVNKNYRTLNLAKQKMTYESHYKVYQKLTSLRRTSFALKYGGLETGVLKNDVLVVARNTTNETLTLLINFSNVTEHKVDLSKTPGTSAILLTGVYPGIKSRVQLNQTTIVLPAKASVVVTTNLTTTKGKSNTKSRASKGLNDSLKPILVLIFIWLFRL